MPHFRLFPGEHHLTRRRGRMTAPTPSPHAMLQTALFLLNVLTAVDILLGAGAAVSRMDAGADAIDCEEGSAARCNNASLGFYAVIVTAGAFAFAAMWFAGGVWNEKVSVIAMDLAYFVIVPVTVVVFVFSSDFEPRYLLVVAVPPLTGCVLCAWHLALLRSDKMPPAARLLPNRGQHDGLTDDSGSESDGGSSAFQQA